MILIKDGRAALKMFIGNNNGGIDGQMKIKKLQLLSDNNDN